MGYGDMLREIKARIIYQYSAITDLIAPGALIIGIVCLMRLVGLLQTQEWMALDSFSRYCPSATAASRVTLVTIDEEDYQTTGLPISAAILTQTLEQLQTYRPSVVGLDISRDLPRGEEYSLLSSVLATMPNVIVAEIALNEEANMNIAPPAGVPPEQIGFADVAIDADGKLRRVVLSAEEETNAPKYSLASRLARYYLLESIEGEGGQRTETQRTETKSEDITDPLRFGSVTVPRFWPNSGGYVRADASGTQMLLNFCMLQQSYETVSLRDLLAGEVNAQLLRDRIIIVGRSAVITKNSFITSAARTTLHSGQSSAQPRPTKIIYGIEIHAHVVQQIVRSVLDEDCALWTWADPVEYFCIVCWGLAGVVISVILRSPWKSVFALGITTVLLTLISYGLLAENIWTPFVPAALALCGAGLTTAFFDREMRFELAQRRTIIERTYEAVHNGPLQHLSALSRQLSTADLSAEQLGQQLRSLNTEMRNIFETMHQDTFNHRESFYVDDSTFFDLQQPISDLLYRIYEHTLSQSLPGFDRIQVFVTPSFETFSEGRFTLEQKRGLCLFLQESLLNVGNHAMNATRLDVICLAEENIYRLQVIDNGVGLENSGPARQGTRQAIAIAQRLNGEFQRRPHSPRGTLCELSWPKRR
ncbi:MAG: CHASE2 domain-containing protein [Cyanobacteria bacterium P01_D01_bin.1]